MSNRPPVKLITVALATVFLSSLYPSTFSFALGTSANTGQENQPSPESLIAAVNQLRINHGLNSLYAHPILMQVAQSQAEALAATGGAVGHSRPAGMTLEAQLLSLGYPLAGDLSLGGFRSENWVSLPLESSAQQAVEIWLGDAPHTNTMLAVDRSDIGAGIARDSQGRAYFVIDTALQTASGEHQSSAYPILTGIPQAQSALLGGASQGALDPSVSQYIVPVTISTARPDGDVIHEVKNGQSLWSIAIAYDTKINQIQRYNNLSEQTIYLGQALLIQKDATQPATAINTDLTPSPQQINPTAPPTSSPTITQTSIPDETVDPPIEPNWKIWLKLLFWIILLVLVMHGVITLSARIQKKKTE